MENLTTGTVELSGVVFIVKYPSDDDELQAPAALLRLLLLYNHLLMQIEFVLNFHFQ